ncbi:hypothetical protein OAO18_09375, partial [Francisellaceae bacterium]|nr:hypothetical protein [Francisellaceae bacterium]
ISKKVSDNEQGQIMGGTVSIFGLSWAFNALLLGPLASWAVFLPIILAVILLLLSVLSAVLVTDRRI